MIDVFSPKLKIDCILWASIYIYIFIFKLEEKVNQYLHFALAYIFLKNNIFPDSIPSKSEWLNSFTSN